MAFGSMPTMQAGVPIDQALWAVLLVAIFNCPVLAQGASPTFCGLQQEVSALALSPDGRILVAVEDGPRACAWEVGSGKRVMTVRFPFLAQGSIAVSSDGKQVAFAQVNTVELWSLMTKRRTRAHLCPDGGIHDVAFSPVGELLATMCSLDNSVWLWGGREGRLLGVLRHDRIGNTCRFSPDGRSLATQDRFGEKKDVIRVWEMATFKVRATWPTGEYLDPEAFSNDSGQLLVRNAAKIQLRDVLTGTIVKTWEVRERRRGQRSWARCKAFSCAAGLLLTTGLDGSAILWSSETGAVVRVVQRKGSIVRAAAFSPDGTSLFLSRGRAVVMWKLRPGKAGTLPQLSEADRRCVEEWKKKFSLYIDGKPGK